MHAEALDREDRIGARRHVAEHLARETQRARIDLAARRRDEREQLRFRERVDGREIARAFARMAFGGFERGACRGSKKNARSSLDSFMKTSAAATV
jgi:hypothetical protein